MLILKSRTRNAPSQSLLTPTPSWSTPMLWASSWATIKAPLPRLWASDIVQDAWIGQLTFCLLIQKLKRQRPVCYTCLTNRPFRCCRRHQTDYNQDQTLKTGGFPISHLAKRSTPVKRRAWSQPFTFETSIVLFQKGDMQFQDKSWTSNRVAKSTQLTVLFFLCQTQNASR